MKKINKDFFSKKNKNSFFSLLKKIFKKKCKNTKLDEK